MATISAGASAVITLAAGAVLQGVGAGLATVGVGARVGAQPLTAGDTWEIGPFDKAEQVYISATGPIDYWSLAPINAVLGVVAWDARPPALGNSGRRIIVSDLNFAEFYSDDTNWLPVNGQYVLFNRVGGAAGPVASVTGTGGAALMGGPVAGIRVPGSLIIPNRTLVQIDAYWNKTGAVAGGACNAWLGTTNSTSDSPIGNQSIGPAANAIWRQSTQLMFTSATSYTESFNGGVGLAQGAVTTSVRSTNLNTAADMFFNFGTTNAAVGDGFQLFNLRISLFS
jgi:hypothetical protein